MPDWRAGPDGLRQRLGLHGQPRTPGAVAPLDVAVLAQGRARADLGRAGLSRGGDAAAMAASARLARVCGHLNSRILPPRTPTAAHTGGADSDDGVIVRGMLPAEREAMLQFQCRINDTPNDPDGSPEAAERLDRVARVDATAHPGLAEPTKRFHSETGNTLNRLGYKGILFKTIKKNRIF